MENDIDEKPITAGDFWLLTTEKEMGYSQKQRERKLWAIMVEALQKHKILTVEQMQEIKSLEVF